MILKCSFYYIVCLKKLFAKTVKIEHQIIFLGQAYKYQNISYIIIDCNQTSVMQIHSFITFDLRVHTKKKLKLLSWFLTHETHGVRQCSTT